MIECTCEVVEAGKTYVMLRFPAVAEDAWAALAVKLAEKRVRQVYVKIGYPRKPRTTGKRSQNTHIHGHATEIAQATGESKSKIIFDAVDIAMGMLGRDFPTHVDYKGDVIPDNEPEWSTVVAAAVIDALHQIASMIPCKLTEYEDEVKET